MAQSIPVHGLHHIAYRCRDAEETRHFYEDLLGLPLVHVVRADTVESTGEPCPFVHLFFEMTDGSCVAFFDLGDDVAAEPSPNTPRWVNHLAMRVGSQTDVDRAKLRLEQAGVEVIGPVSHDGFVHSIYFFDPNGIRLELTVTMASDTEMKRYRDEAHGACAQWMQEKRRRLSKLA
jgi:catechol 2,3-dioxygenase-like lactoylglutathione lyase family enzyme